MKDVSVYFVSVYSYDIAPHSYDIAPPSKRAGLSKSSLCLLANRQQHNCKDITFSFSSTLLGYE